MVMRKGMLNVWVDSQQGKHFCNCGCGEPITIKRHHHARGVPEYIDGHFSRAGNPMSGRSGSKNPNFKGGRYVSRSGYAFVLVPGPGRSRYTPEHRLVMERHLGRKLSRDEVVHHKNGVKSDNRIENLEVMTNSEHTSHHARKGDVGFGRN